MTKTATKTARRKLPDQDDLKTFTDRVAIQNATALLNGRAVPFTEDFKWPGSRNEILFNHDTYNTWLMALMPELESMDPIHYSEASKKGIKVGRYVLYNRLLPITGMASFFLFGTPRPTILSLDIYQRMSKASIRFTAPVGIPVLADASMDPWMSLTPNEILTQRGQVRRARGDVGMAGLGLGWAARRVLERKQVKSLTVYEQDPDVAEYFGGRLRKQFGDRLKVVVADAYKVNWMVHDVALWDIWKNYGGADGDRRFEEIRDALRNAGKVCVGWGDKIYGD